MPMTVRQAGPGDEPDVVRLIRKLATDVPWESPVDVESVRRFLADPSCGILLAVDDGAAVGLLSYVLVPSLFHAGQSGEIETLVVAEDRRGQGVGHRLLATVLELLEDAGCVEISVSTEPDNTVAQKLYVDMGLDEASVLLEKHLPGARADSKPPLEGESRA